MNSQKGFSIIESLVSLTLLSLIGVAFLSSLSTTSVVTLQVDKRETAKNLAETQMEYVKNLAYAASYASDPVPAEYTGYTVSINSVPIQDSNLQKITVTISHQGQPVTALEAYKVR